MVSTIGQFQHSCCDDLGDEDGHFELNGAAPARQRACDWKPAAVGERPQDWAIRDLIVETALADRRSWVLRRLVRNQHPEFISDLDNFSESQTRLLARSRVYLFGHYLSLLRYRRLGDELLSSRVDELWHCCPNLFLVDATLSETARNCQHAKQCPFCFARVASRVYQRITPCVLRNGECLLALLTIQAEVPQLTESLTGEQSPVRSVRRKLSVSARRFLEGIGASASLMTFTIGPRRSSRVRVEGGEHVAEDVYGFLARAAILFPVPDQFSLVLAEASQESSAIDELPALESIRGCGEIDMAVRVHGERDAMRALMFGDRQEDSTGGRIEGAFTFPPWHLATADQWADGVQAMKGTRLFTLRGDWQRPSPASLRHRLVNASARRGRYRQRCALQAANRERHAAADEALASLMPGVRMIAACLEQASGRRPGRKRLMQACREQGVAITDRQVRRALDLLNSELALASNCQGDLPSDFDDTTSHLL